MTVILLKLSSSTYWRLPFSIYRSLDLASLLSRFLDGISVPGSHKVSSSSLYSKSQESWREGSTGLFPSPQARPITSSFAFSCRKLSTIILKKSLVLTQPLSLISSDSVTWQCPCFSFNALSWRKCTSQRWSKFVPHVTPIDSFYVLDGYPTALFSLQLFAHKASFLSTTL